MGWISVSFLIIWMWTNMGLQMDPNSPRWMFRLNTVSEWLGSFAIPLFLLSNFCVILSEKKTYKELLIRNAALTLLIVVLYVLFFRHYLFGMVDVFLQDKKATAEVVTGIIHDGIMTGSLTFNLFIDLFLCTLFMFFLNYVPEKGFFLKHIRLFRALSLLPVLYEIGSLVIRMLSSAGKITPSFYVYPLLTTKPLFSFIMFIALALFLKRRERKFKKNGKTPEEYKAFLKTNANSLHFSIHASIILVVTCVMDFLFFFAAILFYIGISTNGLEGVEDIIQAQTEVVTEAAQEEQTDEAVSKSAVSMNPIENLLGTGTAKKPAKQTAQESLEQELEKATKASLAWGFGKHFALIILLPFIFLLSYTKSYKSQKVDIIIPAAGIILALLVSLECMYRGFLMFAPAIVDDMYRMIYMGF